MTVQTQPNAILEGGPRTGFPDHERVRFVVDLDGPVKVLRGNRWEHFHPAGRTENRDGGDLRVFTWERSTYVAE